MKKRYSSDPDLGELAADLGKTIRAVKHKAARMGLSRGRAPVNKPKNRDNRKLVERNYYKRNKERIYENKMRRLKERKLRLIDILGGKCSECGYNKCVAALEFHHRGDKEDNIAHIIKDGSEQKALKEIRKCILLCANCHREVHNGSIV